MNFKDLNEEQIKYAKTVYLNKDLSWDERMNLLNILFGKSERTTRKWLGKLNIKEKPVIEPEQYSKAKDREYDSSKKVFFVTWGQNNTSPHEKFLKSMETYAKYQSAEIHVIAGRYKNLSLYDKTNETEEYWDESLLPYLDANRHDIHKFLSIMGDVKIQPTAINPMSGMEGMSRENSCIFGHPKVHLQMIPVLNTYNPKMMLTTGAITKLNYSDSKSGKKSEFHHQFGFVIVEIENDEIFHVRQVIANEDDGSFYDLFYYVNGDKVSENTKLEGIVLGDLHYGEHDEKVLDRTFELMTKLVPKSVVLHDVFDAKSISHHTINDPFIQYGMEVNGKNSLKDEIDVMMDGLSKFKKFDNVIVVKSNHDVHLDKFLTNDWRKLPTSKNALEYMQYSEILLKQYSNNKVIGVIPALINKNFPKYKTLTYNDSYKIKDYEIGMHGDIGANGSRGSSVQFRKLNTKLVTAHTHSPSRFDNVICTGTSTKLRLDYNKGASSWFQSHVLIFPNGKAQHVNFVGKYKTYTTFKK